MCIIESLTVRRMSELTRRSNNSMGYDNQVSKNGIDNERRIKVNMGHPGHGAPSHSKRILQTALESGADIGGTSGNICGWSVTS